MKISLFVLWASLATIGLVDHWALVYLFAAFATFQVWLIAKEHAERVAR